MGALTIFGFSLFFIVGVLVGIATENRHQAELRRQQSIKYWRWAKDVSCIEQQMAKDGWRL